MSFFLLYLCSHHLYNVYLHWAERQQLQQRCNIDTTPASTTQTGAFNKRISEEAKIIQKEKRKNKQQRRSRRRSISCVCSASKRRLQIPAERGWDESKRRKKRKKQFLAWLFALLPRIAAPPFDGDGWPLILVFCFVFFSPLFFLRSCYCVCVCVLRVSHQSRTQSKIDERKCSTTPLVLHGLSFDPLVSIQHHPRHSLYSQYTGRILRFVSSIQYILSLTLSGAVVGL